MNTIGSKMPIPENFEYLDVYLKGPPVHEWNDAFRMRHPAMDLRRRAKIFAPFDALEGFDDAIAEKEIQYEFKRELSEDDTEEMNRRLNILHRLAWNTKLARENQVPVSVTYFVPCADQSGSSYGYRGRYVTVSGICQRLGPQSILVHDTEIRLEDIISLESTKEIDGRNIFDCWEADVS